MVLMTWLTTPLCHQVYPPQAYPPQAITDCLRWTEIWKVTTRLASRPTMNRLMKVIHRTKVLRTIPLGPHQEKFLGPMFRPDALSARTKHILRLLGLPVGYIL